MVFLTLALALASPPLSVSISGCILPSLQTTEIIHSDFNKPLFMLFIVICQKLDIYGNNSPLNVYNLII